MGKSGTHDFFDFAFKLKFGSFYYYLSQKTITITPNNKVKCRVGKFLFAYDTFYRIGSFSSTEKPSDSHPIFHLILVNTEPDSGARRTVVLDMLIFSSNFVSIQIAFKICHF